MKYVSLFIISSILCGTNTFDMKYSLLKDVWTKHKTIEESTQKDTTDIYPEYSMQFWGPKSTQLLKSTVLAGGVLLTDSYLIFADFQINVTIPSCLFSMERKEKPKLALCLQPAGNDAVTLTLDAANIPDGKISFGHKIQNNQRTKLIVSVKSTGVTLLKDCRVIEEKRFSSNISKQIHLTNEMELVLGKFTPPEPKLMMELNNLDLYSPVDATTLMTLCPDILPPEIKGERGEKGDQGQYGVPGLQGPVGYPGRAGLKGDKGDEGNIGPRGRDGMYGLPGMKGDTGVGEKAERGERGEQGERGERGPPGPSCPATAVAPTVTPEMDVLKSMLSDIKSIFNNYILEKTEQLKYFTELNTKCNERLTTAELNIEALKNAMLTEGQL